MIEMNKVAKVQNNSLKQQPKTKAEDAKSFFETLSAKINTKETNKNDKNVEELVVPEKDKVDLNAMQNLICMMQADALLPANFNELLSGNSQNVQVIIEELLPVSNQMSVQNLISNEQNQSDISKDGKIILPMQLINGEELTEQEQVLINKLNTQNQLKQVDELGEVNPEKDVTVNQTNQNEKVEVNQNNIQVKTEKTANMETSSLKVDVLEKQDVKEQVPAKFEKNLDEKENLKLNEQTVLQDKPVVLTRDMGFVKISDVSSKLDVSLQQQITNNIKANVKEGKTEFTMQLFPKDLGKVSVRMVAENGLITIEMVAENPKTQSLLLSNSTAIKEIVETATSTNTQIVTPNEAMQQDYVKQQADKENQQNHQSNQANKDKKDNNDDGVAVDFTSILEQMRQASNLNRIKI